MSAAYCDIEPYVCEWMRRLIAGDHIADGAVLERSIIDLAPADVEGATQFHAFAGIGVWSHALRLAGWPDDVPVWTGSCPCTPFSVAGKREGFNDERHLWPDWFRLVRACRPPIIFAEQTSSDDGLDWLDLVLSDLEGEGYECAAADLCAASMGAPHIRQRLFFVALANPNRELSRSWRAGATRRWAQVESDRLGAVGIVADDASERSERVGGARRGWCGSVEAGGVGIVDDDDGRREEFGIDDGEDGDAPSGTHADGRSEARGAAGGVGDSGGDGDRQHARELPSHEGQYGRRTSERDHPSVFAGATRGFWAGADWVWCRDGKYRPTEPGLEPLVDGTFARVGRLRAYGNAIVAQVAATFIRSVMDEVIAREERDRA